MQSKEVEKLRSLIGNLGKLLSNCSLMCLAIYLVNCLFLKILRFKSPTERLSKFYRNIHTTKNLITRIFGLFIN